MSDFPRCPQCDSQQCIGIAPIDAVNWFKCTDCGCVFDEEYAHMISTLCQD